MSLKREHLLIEASGRSSYRPESHYVAISLSAGSRKAMSHHFPSAYKQRSADHVTLNYDPSQEELDRIRNTPAHRRIVNFHATHHAHDPEVGIHAVRVSGVEHLTDRQHPHITISRDTNVRAVQSNDMLSKQQGTRVSVTRADKHGKTRKGYLPLTGRVSILPKNR